MILIVYILNNGVVDMFCGFLPDNFNCMNGDVETGISRSAEERSKWDAVELLVAGKIDSNEPGYVVVFLLLPQNKIEHLFLAFHALCPVENSDETHFEFTRILFSCPFYSANNGPMDFFVA